MGLNWNFPLKGIGLTLFFPVRGNLGTGVGISEKERFHQWDVFFRDIDWTTDRADAFHSQQYTMALCQDVTHKTEAVLVHGLKAEDSALSIW